jgi:pilus assembly protein CpaE
MDKHTIVLAGVEPTLETALRAALQDARIVALPTLELEKEEIRALKAAIAVVWLSGNRDAAYRLVNALAATGARVVVVGPMKDPDLILRAMREGAREYLGNGETEKLLAAIRDQARPPRAAGLGSVIAVFPAKGGVGATAIATNLAGALARRGERACLVDLDLSMGDALAFLDLSRGYAISDVIANMQRLDRELLDASVLHHESGVHVLAQTEKIEEASRIHPESLASLIHFLRVHYRMIVLDGLRTLDDHAVATLEACDQILLLVTQEVPAVRRAQRVVSFLRRLGHEDSRVRLVVNRHSRLAEIKDELIAETIGLPISATIASDYHALIRAINHGKLLMDEAPRSELARDIEALKLLIGYAPEPVEEKPSLLKRLFAQKVAHAH